MTDLVAAKRSRTAAVADPTHVIETLATLMIVTLTVGILYVAREILVPVSIAVLLSFVLSPLVKLLRSVNIGKSVSVVIVVVAAFALSVGVGVIMAKQVSDLAADAPRYQETIGNKVKGARTFLSTNPLLRKASEALSDVAKINPPRIDKPQSDERPGSSAPNASGLTRGTGPVPVTLVEPSLGIVDVAQKVASIAVSPLATAAFVAIFIVFILMQREDLRNRFIRLVGSSDLQRTTLAMNDAARRLSRYFLAQMLLNTAFGIVVAIALSVIGVPSAILWGSFAILMRFIPYVGAIGAAFFPILLAAAAGSGWAMVIETAALFVIIEVVVGQVIEPLLYGHHTGMSPIAVVLSATFWTWLWGPVGLVLSTPLTVCLVVIGRHVERLAFLDIILGDAPALTPVESFYQRVLAGDASEIADHADQYLKTHSLMEYCDDVALHALLLAQRDVRRGRLEDERLGTIKETVDVLMEDLFDRDLPGADTASETESLQEEIEPYASLAERDRKDAPVHADGEPDPVIQPVWTRPTAVLCIAGRTPLDEAAAQLLADLLGRRGIGAHVEPSASLTGNNLAHLAEAEAQLIILSFLDADLSIPQARFAVRRLRRRIPNVPIVAAFWMEQGDQGRATGLCSDVKSDLCVSTLADAVAICVDRASAADVEIAA